MREDDGRFRLPLGWVEHRFEPARRTRQIMNGWH
jgi:hypothetical protein